MSHSVPNWNLDDASIPASRLTATNSSDVPFLGYEMAELTWENGQLSVNGFGPGLTRVSNPTTAKDAWDNPRAAVGTLESIVDLATQKPPPPPMDKGDYGDVGVPWLDCRNHDQRSPPGGSSAAASVTDALVPCGTPKEEEREGSRVFRGKGISTCVVDRSARVKKRMPATRVPVEGERSSQQSLSVSSLGGSESRHVLTADTCEKDSGGFGVATASFCSQGTTLSLSSSEKPATTLDNHGSVCLTRSPQGDTCDKEDNKKGKGARSSLSTKRSRTAAIHNQSERKRRDTINQKMKMLQKMVPNSSKTDKASMLDEVIDYLKQLQAQVHMMMMSRMSIQSMMMPFAMPQHPLHMPMMGMDMSIINPIMARQNLATLSPLLNPSAAFMPMAPWDDATTNPSPSSAPLGSSDPSTYLAHCQSQPMSMEAYTRMVALIQQQQQQLQLASAKN